MRNEVTTNKSKRIATNTLLLFVRMFVVTILNLYILRIVLNSLGKQDYGVYNTIAGFVTTAVFFNTVLALSMQRFYSYAIGEHQAGRQTEIFTASINIVATLSLCIFLFMETVGLWFADTQLVIPDDRSAAALCVYHLALFTFVCSLAQIPFTATIFANEDLNIYAIISIVEVTLKLAAAWLIGKTSADGLVFYGAALFVVALLILCTYVFIGLRRYKECRYRRVYDRSLYRKLISFSGWTMLGSLSNVGMFQGSIILLDMVFGPLATVPFAIAQQINNAFNALSNSMLLAFRPAMIKAYASKQFDYLNKLFTASNKFIAYTLTLIGVPIFMEIDFILVLWLGEVTLQDILFARLIIIFVVCMALSGPLTVIMQASGFIKQYHLPVESVTLMCLPLTYLLFRLGLPPHSVFYAMIGTCLLAHIVRLLCLRRYYPYFSLRQYIRTLIVPAILIAAITVAVAASLHTTIEPTLLRTVVVSIAVPTATGLCVLLFGINRQERQLLASMVCHRQKSTTPKEL